MKVIVLLAGYGTRMRPHTWSRPKPLLKVAGNTVVGHLLDLMSDITCEEVIFVVGYKGEQLESWIRENYPHLNAHFIVQEEAKGQAHAVWLCQEYLDESEVVVAFGDGVVKADYTHLAHSGADGVFLVKEVEDPRPFGVVVLDENGYITKFVEKPKTMEHRLAIAGIYWFRSGRFLFQALDTIIQQERTTLGEYFMADAFQVMLENGARLQTMEVEQWADAGTPEAILNTNARLLSVGYSTQDALERGYSEGFTVVPPVYIHPTAEIEASVIGPYASVDADVKIQNAIVRDSIIDTGAYIENCVLEKALVGEQAKVTGRGKALFVGDNSYVDLG
ncbi:MAG: NTP transferase domain-containing protein [Chloroflexi bacterium]|nr:NTP transferase domain-containing protein [Chloroflexota bacterium]MCI0578326.1 NTP transferase domain-containing protein [Chloroflexota bacterium]MCI0649006.1 NTP transferase domain-containing protein [Chloroflexota bacterium]MCI0729441.1 NTP transferase domain-containing protein [Chloroflexota bacterium]